MPSPKKPTLSREQTLTEAEQRQQRLAQALRDNLRRRKAQKRGRDDHVKVSSSDQHQED